MSDHNGMNDLMVDIETMGTGPDSVVLSVAWVPFEPARTGTPQYFVLNAYSQIAKGRVMDFGTVSWWMRQSAQAAGAWLDKPSVDAPIALNAFFEAVRKYDRVWANSPSFDLVILTSLANSFAIPLPPAFYRQFRDQRTVNDYADKIDFIGVEHNPVADCRNQIEVVRSAWARIGYPDAKTENGRELTQGEKEESSALPPA